MAGEPTLVAQKRERTGTAESRRLRRSGRIPGNLYGHGLDTVLLTVAADEFNAIIHGTSHLVKVELPGGAETALVQDVQWDTFGVEVQHFDLLRVDLSEEVSVDVEVTLVGTAAGTLSGGVVEQPVHSLELTCRAGDVPDTVEVRIQDLEIGGSITVGDLELPDGVTCQLAEDQVVVQVVEPTETEEQDESLGGPAEPEVIGKKDDDGEGGD